MASLSAEPASPQLSADRWTTYSVTVWAICMLGFAFDIYEATIMQLVTPLLIKEWGAAPHSLKALAGRRTRTQLRHHRGTERVAELHNHAGDPRA